MGKFTKYLHFVLAMLCLSNLISLTTQVASSAEISFITSSQQFPNSDQGEMMKNTFRVLNPESDQPFSELASKIERLLKTRLKQVSDRYDHIHFFFNDALDANAAVVADPANPKVAYVSLNLGIARYTNSDDQLAGVIGHELEHPQSDLGAEQRRIRNIPSTYGVREYADVVKAWQLGRLEEIEVDVKSVYNALIEGGFNPYEYQRLIENFERDFGNSDGGSHARTSSRDTALTLELAGVRHGQGREIKTTGSEHNLINPTLHSHIDAVHGARHAQLWDQYLTDLRQNNPFDAIFAKIARGDQLTEEERAIHQQSHLQSTIRRFEHQPQNIDPREEVRRAAEQRKLLLELRDEAYTRIFPEGSSKLHPNNWDDLWAIMSDSDEIDYFSMKGYPSVAERWAQADYLKWAIEEAEKKLLHAEGDEALKIRSRMESHQNDLAKFQHGLDEALNIFNLGDEFHYLTLPIDEREKRGRIYAETIGIDTPALRVMESNTIFGEAEARHNQLLQNLATEAFDVLPRQEPEKRTFENLNHLAEIRGWIFNQEFRRKHLRAQIAKYNYRAQQKVNTESNMPNFSAREFFFETLRARNTPIGQQDEANHPELVHELLRAQFNWGMEASQTLAHLNYFPITVLEKNERDIKSFGISDVDSLRTEVFNTDMMLRYVEKTNRLLAHEMRAEGDKSAADWSSMLRDYSDILGRLKSANYFAPEFYRVGDPMGDTYRTHLDQLDRQLLSEGKSPALVSLIRSINLINNEMHFPVTDEERARAREVLARLPEIAAELGEDSRYLNQSMDFDSLERHLGPLAECTSSTCQWLRSHPEYLAKDFRFFYKSSDEIREAKRRRLEYADHVMDHHVEKFPEAIRAFQYILTDHSPKQAMHMDPALRSEVNNNLFGMWVEYAPEYFSDNYPRHGNPDEKLAHYRNRHLNLIRRLDEPIFEVFGDFRNDVDRMAAYLGYMDAELIRNQELDPNYKAKARNGTSALWESGIKGTLPSTLDGEVPLSWKIRYWQNLTISSSDRSPTLDNDLRSIRNQAARLNDEEALKLLRDETLINRLHLESSRHEFARWQISQIYPLDAWKRRLRNGNYPLPQITDPVRHGGGHQIDVYEIERIINNQFPEPSIAKDELIEELGRDLLLTPEEYRILAAHKINKDNWTQSSKIFYAEIPDRINEEGKSHWDRLQILNYFTDESRPLPDLATEIEQKIQRPISDQLKSARALFSSLDQASRAVAILPMLDHNTGILSDPELANVIKKQILGEMSENKVLSAIFDGYMNNLPPGEKEVFLSHILSKKRTGSNLEPGENLRTILEAMGPFGIKVGQYLRASGILEERYSQHLKAFFDNALPPNRGQIISDVERALQQSGNLLAIGDRKGSGSINYFVEVQIRDPKSGQERNVGLRVHRSESEGRVAIQNQAWEDMIGDLNSSADSDVKDAAWALETARRNSMRTVGPGMVEHDLSREVENSRRASSIYDRSGTGDSPHIEALKIDEDLQRLLPAELQREFVITELVEHTPWEELSDLEKKKYGRAVVEAELRAVFQSGVFDPDTHPGNWLVDREFDNNRGRLVRIDYSQITEIPDSERISLANVVNEMLIPSHFERNRVRQLERNLSQILHLEGDGQIRQADIQQIINRTEYIALTDPINKLLFLVRELDRANPNGHVRLTDSSQDAISSLSRLMEYSEMVDEGDLRRILSEIVPGLKRKGVTDTVTRPFASPFQSSSSKGFCDAARKSLSPKP